jgi:hypothetical protein
VAICAAIHGIPGVQRVVANPVTGSITITYERSTLTGEAVRKNVEQIVGCNVLWVPTQTTPAPSRVLADAGQHFAHALVKTAMEAALQRAILALI